MIAALIAGQVGMLIVLAMMWLDILAMRRQIRDEWIGRTFENQRQLHERLMDELRETLVSGPVVPIDGSHRHCWYFKGRNLWYCKCGCIAYWLKTPDGRDRWIVRAIAAVTRADRQEREAYDGENTRAQSAR